MILRRLLPAIVLLAALPAAARKGRVTEANFTRTDQTMVFNLKADQALDPTRVERMLDDHGRVLVIRVGGVEHPRRQWLKTRDPKISRTLLHNAKRRAPAALIRVRFKRAVPLPIYDAIQLKVTQNHLRIVVPQAAPVAPVAKAGVAQVAAVKAGAVKRGKTTKGAVAVAAVAAAAPCPKLVCPKLVCPKSTAQVCPQVQPGTARRAEPKAVPPSAVPPRGSSQPIKFNTRASLTAVAPVQAVDALAGVLKTSKAGAVVAVLPASAEPDLEGARPAFATALLSARLSKAGHLKPLDPHRTSALVEAAVGPDGAWQPSWDAAAAAGRLMGAELVLVSHLHRAGPAMGLQTLLIDARTGKPQARGATALELEAYEALYTDTVDRRDASDAVWRSAVAPGWGQIYNGDVGRGAGYAAAAGVLFAGAAASMALGLMAESDYADNDPASVVRRDDANAHYDRTNYLLATLGAVWVASMVDAWLTAQPRASIDHAALEAQ